jgi:hypothetical protein
LKSRVDRLNVISVVLTFAGFAWFGVVLVVAGSVRMGGVAFSLAGLGLFFNGLWRIATRSHRPIADLHPFIRLALYGWPIPWPPDEFFRAFAFAVYVVIAMAFIVGGGIAVVIG